MPAVHTISGFEIDEDLDEYNPTFILKFKYNEEYAEMKEMIDKAVELISNEMNNVFKNIEGKEDEYKEE